MRRLLGDCGGLFGCRARDQSRRPLMQSKLLASVFQQSKFRPECVDFSTKFLALFPAAAINHHAVANSGQANDSPKKQGSNNIFHRHDPVGKNVLLLPAL